VDSDVKQLDFVAAFFHAHNVFQAVVSECSGCWRQVASWSRIATTRMADKSADELWSHAALWPECLSEPAGPLMAIPDAEHMLHMMEDSNEIERKASAHEGADVHKESAPQIPDAGDDGLGLDPPAKLQATCKADIQVAKTKAFREKQRRAQLNNRCGLRRSGCCGARRICCIMLQQCCHTCAPVRLGGTVAIHAYRLSEALEVLLVP
jgi:hypothetical protein